MTVSTFNASIWNHIYNWTVNAVAGHVRCASKWNVLTHRFGCISRPLRLSFICSFVYVSLDPISKTTLTEHLEIDQYIWAILNTLGSTPADDVIIDSEANWKSVPVIGTANIKVSIEFLFIATLISSYFVILLLSSKNPLVQSPCSWRTTVKRSDYHTMWCRLDQRKSHHGTIRRQWAHIWAPTWAQLLAAIWLVKRKRCTPLVIDSAPNFGLMLCSFHLLCSNRSYDNATNGTATNEYSHNNPLVHLSESVNAIDPLNAMEKSLNEVSNGQWIMKRAHADIREPIAPKRRGLAFVQNMIPLPVSIIVCRSHSGSPKLIKHCRSSGVGRSFEQWDFRL